MTTAPAFETTHHPASHSWPISATLAQRVLVVAGRALFAAIFLMSAPHHFSRETIEYAAGQGVPAAGLLVPLSGLLALLGGALLFTQLGSGPCSLDRLRPVPPRAEAPRPGPMHDTRW